MSVVSIVSARPSTTFFITPIVTIKHIIPRLEIISSSLCALIIIPLPGISAPIHRNIIPKSEIIYPILLSLEIIPSSG